MDYLPEPAPGRPPLTLVAASAAGRAAGEEAARLAGLPVAAVLGWEVAAGDVALAGPVLLEADGLDPDLLADALPDWQVAAASYGVALVTAIAPAQLDWVGPLLGAEPPLCDASLGDRVAALVLATAAPSSRAREGADDAAPRLAALGAEIARLAEALVEAARREPGRAVADRTRGYQPPPADGDPAPVTAPQLRGLIRARRGRDKLFGAALFEDPAWDMLLDLYAAELERTAVSISSLCIAAAVAPTTALRYIGRMIEAGLLERHPDPADRRRAFMRLAPPARAGLVRYFGEVARAGLAAG